MEITPVEPPPVNLSSARQATEYTDQHLKVLGKLVLGLSKNERFRSILYKQIEEKFDGDYNALFEVLETEISMSMNENVTKSFFTQNSIESNWHFSKDAFKKKSLANVPYDMFPQVFIPFYSELKMSGKLGKKIPVIVIHSGNEHGENNDDKFRGFSIAQNGKLIELSDEIDERFASANEVWVISINERIGKEGVKKSDKGSFDKRSARWSQTSRTCTDDYTDCIGPIANCGVSPAGIDVKIGSMNVKCHKESWIAGASEIGLLITSADCQGTPGQAQRVYWAPNAVGLGEYTTRVTSSAYEFATVRRGDIGSTKTLNKSITFIQDRPYGNYQTSGDTLIDV